MHGCIRPKIGIGSDFIHCLEKSDQDHTEISAVSIEVVVYQLNVM